jgi:hypothetical protein
MILLGCMSGICYLCRVTFGVRHGSQCKGNIFCIIHQIKRILFILQTTFFMDGKLERLQKAVDALKYLGVFKTQQDAADQTLMSRPNFSAALNGSEKYFTENFLDRFLSVFGNTISSE